MPLAGLAWVAGVVLFAGFVHGVIGFGFPLVAMPLLAIVVDYKAAVLFTLVPILFLNFAGTFAGRGTAHNFARFWAMPIVMVAGVWVGTLALIHIDPAPFLLVLVVAILLFLNVDRLGRLDLSGVKRHAAAWGIVTAFIAGLFEATVNVAVPPLLIFFMLIGLAPGALVQALNLCFIGGKIVQIGVWTTDGGIAPSFWLYTVPWGIAAVGMFFVGARIRNRLPPQTYLRWLRGFLWAMSGVLTIHFILAIAR